MSNNSYFIKEQQRNTKRLRNLIADLPSFCEEYFRGIEHTTSILTRINYAYDLRIFFDFLTKEIDVFQDLSPFSFTLEHLDQVQVLHIEKYLEYTTYYTNPNNEEQDRQNSEMGKARKLASVRSLLSYFFKKEKINRNVAQLVDTPKLTEKPIIRLEVDEVAKLLDAVESGEKLTANQRRYHKYTKSRDLAILTLLLGTGIRISECVGLNITDFDFNNNSFKVTRKGGDQEILYYGDEVKDAILNYLEERKKIQTLPGHEDALFLSIQKKRISHRALQNLVKKYAKIVSPLKRITPHKLRSTYGTTLYQETGDIYLVADVLGHKDVNTTRKHYAAISEEKRRLAARVIKLRED
ncbi:MAG: tyrosine-type recombinase/integrase [Caldicoprobacterales bacterium]|nr:tyrosine-type recombinase/integrase [Clostridiales bacterium]